MTLNISSSPTPKVHWTMVDGSDLAEKVEVTSFGQEIVIYDVDYPDEGRYRCHAQNLQGPDAGSTAVTQDLQLRVECKFFSKAYILPSLIRLLNTECVCAHKTLNMFSILIFSCSKTFLD